MLPLQPRQTLVARTKAEGARATRGRSPRAGIIKGAAAGLNPATAQALVMGHMVEAVRAFFPRACRLHSFAIEVGVLPPRSAALSARRSLAKLSPRECVECRRT